MFGEFPANDRGSQGECIGDRHLAEKLSFSVEIPCVRVIFFGVLPTFAAEYAVGAEMDDASAPNSSHLGKLVGQE